MAAHPPWQVKGKARIPDQKNHKVDKLPVIIKIHTEKVHQFEFEVGRMVNSIKRTIKHKKKAVWKKSILLLNSELKSELFISAESFS